MTSVLDPQAGLGDKGRLHVSVRLGHVGETREAVDDGELSGDDQELAVLGDLLLERLEGVLRLKRQSFSVLLQLLDPAVSLQKSASAYMLITSGVW